MALKRKQKINPRQVLKERRSYCDQMCGELEDQGIKFFMPEDNLNISTDYLTLPMEITEVSSRDLGEYLNTFTQQKVYLRTVLGFAELMSEEARREYVSVSEDHFRDLLGAKLSETAKEREVNSNPEVRPVYEAWIDAKNKVKLLSYNITSIEDIIFMLSREVSRRTGDFAEERRDYNVHG